MNTTELKALAEKATQGGWEAAGPSFGDPLPRYCNEVLAISDGDEEAQVCRAPEGLEDACTDDMKFIAAANPAAILELIAQLEESRTQMERQKDEWLSWEAKRRDLEKAAAQLEDAQGEIRALRATEAGLRERVKELEEGLADAAQSLCWLAFGESQSITCRPLKTAPQVEAAARALLEKQQ